MPVSGSENSDEKPKGGRLGAELGVIILAAGASRRMGRQKMLLPWGGSTVLGHVIQMWGGLGAGHVAVVIARGSAVEGELDRLGICTEDRIINSDPERGMFSSIQSAAQWNGWRQSLTHWAIVLGDQPHLGQTTLERLLEFAARHPAQVCQPSRAGRGRHPVVLPASSFQRLRNARSAHLKEFLAGEEVCRCEIDDSGLDLDLDSPEDYETARRAYLG